MPQTKTKLEPLRYSPKSIVEYGDPRLANVGPAHSLLLAQDVAAWNLAFLSHPYENRLEHVDPHFTIRVWHTVQTTLGTGTVDRFQENGEEALVRCLLRQPAERFIEAILTAKVFNNCSLQPLLPLLPLFQAYGEAWVTTMRERAALCLRAPVASEWQPGDDVEHVRDAAAVLRKFLK